MKGPRGVGWGEAPSSACRLLSEGCAMAVSRRAMSLLPHLAAPSPSFVCLPVK